MKLLLIKLLKLPTPLPAPSFLTLYPSPSIAQLPRLGPRYIIFTCPCCVVCRCIGTARTKIQGWNTQDLRYNMEDGTACTNQHGLKMQDNGLDHGQRTEEQRARTKHRAWQLKNFIDTLL